MKDPYDARPRPPPRICIGRGSHGAVYRWTLRDPARTPVTVKRVHLPTCARSGLEHPEREIQLLSRLRGHPNILTLLTWAVDVHSASLLICTEYASAGDLAAYLARRQRARQPLSDHSVAAFLVQLALAVDAVHGAGIVHRDIKAANVFLAPNRTGGDVPGKYVLKLGDFGIAKRLPRAPPEAVATTATAIGTPVYLSPERCRGARYGLAVDMWSLGVVLVELITFRRPFRGDDVDGVVDMILHARPALGLPAMYDATNTVSGRAAHDFVRS
ncbi:hypothetical protein H9P43_006276 [Blastocladiella emersonii ATCC 22665]|nr:hypothetical protein H9P43_006276 [Blastocladiella emersonii ATCC 22665]